MNETKNKLQLSSPEPSERLLKIFEFLKTYLDLRYPHVRDVSQQMRVLWLNDLAQHPAIEIFHPNGDADQESEDESDIVLRITRPGTTTHGSPSGVFSRVRISQILHRMQPGKPALPLTRSAVLPQHAMRTSVSERPALSWLPNRAKKRALRRGPLPPQA